jgi:hypothetical protein
MGAILARKNKDAPRPYIRGRLHHGYPAGGGNMKVWKDEKGAIGWILLWLIGIPVPLLLLFFLLRGCT